MYFIKKIFLYTIIILLLLSLYNDFKKDSVEDSVLHDVPETAIVSEQQVVRIKLERGDTFLSIFERLNGSHLSEMSIDDMIADFEKINPNTDVYALNIGSYYYFPIYEKN